MGRDKNRLWKTSDPKDFLNAKKRGGFMDKLRKAVLVFFMSMFFVLDMSWVSFIMVIFFKPYVKPVRRPVPKYISLGKCYNPR